MEEKDIFKDIKQRVDEEQLPFDDSDWADLQSRLDSKEEKRIIPFFPFHAKKAVAAAVATAAIVIMGLFILNRQNNDLPATPIVTSAPVTPPPASQAVTTPEEEDVPIPPAVVESSSSKRPAARKKYTPALEGEPAYEIVKPLEVYFEPQKQQIAEVKPADTMFKSIRPSDRNEPKKFDYAEFGEREVPTEKKIYFLAGGGIIAADNSLGYSLNAAIAKKISGTATLQAGVAYIGRNQSTDVTQTTISQHQVIGVNGATLQYDTTTSKATNRLPQSYAQAEVAMGLQLLKRSNLLIGVDVQKLLEAKEDVYALNSVTSEEKDIPIWSSGVKLRYQYMFIKNLSLGLAYRLDVSSALTNKVQSNFTQAYITYQFRR
jgi:hypothetical protein